MKSKFFPQIIALLVIAYQDSAQAPIIRQNGNATNFYTTVPAAVAAANSGDTIYVPGGSWNIGTLGINKTLHIIGVGHNPDSSLATGFTYLTGNIQLQSGSSNGSLSGLYISNQLTYNISSDTITSYSIRRCRFGGAVTFSSNFSFGLIAENVFDWYVTSISAANNNDFISNIFTSCVGSFGPSNTFKNNLFTAFLNGCTANFTGNCLFENNIFLPSNIDLILSRFTNCIFNNNLFVANFSFPYNSNLGSNNIVNQAQSSIMINQNGTSYAYSQNYHMQATSPGHNGGADGADVGVYGGMSPWKEGSIPLNPHIQYKNIANNTDQNGNLQINIKVKAQDH